MTDRMIAPASIRAASLDTVTRTFQVVFASEMPVTRRDYEGAYLEVLRCTKEAVDTCRLDAGASFLDSHRSSGMQNRLGGIVPGSLKFEPGKALATIKLSRSAEADRILADLEDDVPVPVSVGYSILTSERAEGDNDALPTLTITRWCPYEISAVPVPADPTSTARSEDENEDTPMPETKSKRTNVNAPSSAPSTRELAARNAEIVNQFRSSISEEARNRLIEAHASTGDE